MLENLQCSLYPEPSVDMPMCPLCLCFLSLPLFPPPSSLHPLCTFLVALPLCHLLFADWRPICSTVPTAVRNRLSAVKQTPSGVVTHLSVMANRKALSNSTDMTLSLPYTTYDAMILYHHEDLNPIQHVWAKLCQQLQDLTQCQC